MAYQHHPLPVLPRTVSNGRLSVHGHVLGATDVTVQTVGVIQGITPECMSTRSVFGFNSPLTARHRSPRSYDSNAFEIGIP